MKNVQGKVKKEPDNDSVLAWIKNTYFSSVGTSIITIIFVFFLISYVSQSNNTPKACDCVMLIYEGESLGLGVGSYFGADDKDKEMLREGIGWDDKKFDKWTKCHNEYLSSRTAQYECDKANYKKK
jgi:hypothetical protein